jgi:CheY-like chemotaxis protein
MATILIIEDDFLTTALYRTCLTDWGYTVRSAVSTSQAVESVETDGAPDAIVSDYRLGYGDTGVRAIRMIEASLGRKIPTVMITSERGPLDIDAPVLIKPISRADLKNALMTILQEH